jgi:acetyl-CoA carboxylase alpha subunit
MRGILGQAGMLERHGYWCYRVTVMILQIIGYGGSGGALSQPSMASFAAGERI